MLELKSFQEKHISEIMMKINAKHDLIQRHLLYNFSENVYRDKIIIIFQI